MERCAFGCYDWDPFASVLSFPLLMVRQDVEGLLREAFRIIDARLFAEKRIIEIKPELLFMPEDPMASLEPIAVSTGRHVAAA